MLQATFKGRTSTPMAWLRRAIRQQRNVAWVERSGKQFMCGRRSLSIFFKSYGRPSLGVIACPLERTLVYQDSAFDPSTAGVLCELAALCATAEHFQRSLKTDSRLVALSPTQKASIIRELLLRGRSEPLRKLLSGAAKKHDTTIDNVVVPTSATRVRSTKRLLKSLARSRLHCSDPINLHLFCSEVDAVANAFAAATRLAPSDQQRLMIHVHGASERQDLISRLERVGFQRSLVEFALLGCGVPDSINTGANQNASLLNLCGKRLISVDDDVIWKFARPLTYRNSMTLSSDRDRRLVSFAYNREELMRLANRLENTDALKEHGIILGADLFQLCNLPGLQELRLDRLDLRMIERLVDGKPPKIMVSSSGVIGDSGCATGSHWLWNPGNWSPLIRQSDELRRCALESRNVFRCAEDILISSRANLQTMAVGLANDHLLPPFLPFGRNQDGLFGQLIQLMYPWSIAHMPLAVTHAPFECRRYRAIPEYRCAEMFMTLLKNRQSCGDPEETLRSIGRYLIDIASYCSADLVMVLKTTRSEYQNHLLQSISRALNLDRHAPDSWSSELRATEELINQASGVPGAEYPMELRGLDLETQKMGRLRWLILSFGSLLAEWPDIVRASR